MFNKIIDYLEVDKEENMNHSLHKFVFDEYNTAIITPYDSNCRAEIAYLKNNYKDKNFFLPIICGTVNIRYEFELIFTIWNAINNEISKQGLNKPYVYPLINRIKEWLIDDNNYKLFQYLGMDSHFLHTLYGLTRDEIFQSFETDNLCSTMLPLLSEFGELNNIPEFKTDIHELRTWVENLFAINDIHSIYIIWDDFSYYLRDFNNLEVWNNFFHAMNDINIRFAVVIDSFVFKENTTYFNHLLNNNFVVKLYDFIASSNSSQKKIDETKTVFVNEKLDDMLSKKEEFECSFQESVSLDEKQLNEIINESTADILPVKIELNQDMEQENIETDEGLQFTFLDHISISDELQINIAADGAYKDQPIDELKLSHRAYNCLRRANIYMISELIMLSYDDLTKIKNLGSTSCDEVINKLRVFFSIPKELNRTEEDTEEQFVLKLDTPIDRLDLSVRAKNCLTRNEINTLEILIETSSEIIRTINNIGEKTYNEIIAYRDSMIEELTNKNNIVLDQAQIDFRKKLLRKKLITEISQYIHTHHMFGTNVIALNEKFSSEYTEFDISEIIESEFADKLEYVENDRFVMLYPCLIDFLRIIDLKENNIDIISQRLNGKTLEEIASQYGLTRERVRQIQEKTIRQITHLSEEMNIRAKEMRFEELFSKYNLDLEQFSILTGENTVTYIFLDLAYKKGSRPFEDIISDAEIPAWLKKNWIEYCCKSNNSKFVCLLTDNHYLVEKNRQSLMTYYISKYCSDEIQFEDFVSNYNRFLSENGITSNSLYISESEYRTQENWVVKQEFVLWKYGRRMRFYNIPVRDYSELLLQLNLSQYKNTELSTYKFFVDYPDLMKDYDIRDEYELHNLLKKLDVESKYDNIKIGSMPMILFGEVNRTDMVRKLLFQNAPIKNEDLAEIITAEYGFRNVCGMKWFLDAIGPYCENGICSVDYVPMREKDMYLLSQKLNEDFYYLSDVERVYKELIDDADVSLLSSYNLKKMGFVVNSTYIIKNFSSASQYFRYLLLKDEMTDITEYSERFSNIMQFSATLANLKDSYEIVEYLPYKYIRDSKLLKMNVSKEDLKEYCNIVYSLVSDDEYYTVESLLKNGFESNLSELSFEPWFFSSLLREDSRFSYVKLGGTVLFIKGNIEITFQTFIEYLMNEEEVCSVDALLILMQENYNIIINKSKLKECIKHTSMYLDPTSEIVYCNFGKYMDEIEINS